MIERPVYEQERDVANATRAIQVCNIALQARAVPLPRMHAADFSMYRGPNFVCFIEVKCRNVPHDRFPSVLLFERKWKDLRALATNHRSIGLWAVGLWVQWSDDIYGLARLDILPDLKPLEVNGRKDRGDPKDIQPCVFIDLRHFSLYTDQGKLISGGVNG